MYIVAMAAELIFYMCASITVFCAQQIVLSLKACSARSVQVYRVAFVNACKVQRKYICKLQRVCAYNFDVKKCVQTAVYKH